MSDSSDRVVRHAESRFGSKAPAGASAQTVVRSGTERDAFRRRTTKIDPESLRLFVEVVQEGTITAAARHEHIVPTAVSKRITRLEELLRTPLVTRTNKGLRPTPAGRLLIKLARRVLLDLEDLHVEMLEYSGGIRGHVKVAAIVSAITEFLPAEIKTFRIRYPQMQIEIEEQGDVDVARAVAEGAAHVGILTRGTPSSEALETFPYHAHELVVITPNDHPLAAKASVAFAETLAFDHVVLHGESVLGLQAQGAVASSRERTPRLRIRVNAYDALCRIVEAGLGIGVMPRAVAQLYVEGGRVRAVELDEPWAVRELQLCIASSTALPISARLLLEHLRAAQPP